MSNYAMFTFAGNDAVSAIIKYHTDNAHDHDHLYDLVLGDLERLETIPAFQEATDTEVRESVYGACLKLFPTPVFRSVRA